MRGALRRPGGGLLVVLGLLAMTVAVVASLVAADSLEDLLEQDAHARWGAVDVAVTSLEGPFTDEGLARTVGAEGAAASAGWAPRLVLDGVARVGEDREPDVAVVGVSADEPRLAGVPTGRGTTDPARLGPDQVVLNERLARRTGAGPGDRVELVLAVPAYLERDRSGVVTAELDPAAVRWEADVAGIAADDGVADLDRAPVVLARLDALQRVTGLAGKVTGLYAAARAPGEDAADQLVEAYRPVTRLTGLGAVPVKEQALSVAEEESGLFRGILLSLALLVAAAAVAVTLQLVVLLGAARSAEVAVLRSLGARQGDVARLLVVEGVLYAVVASVLGALLAVPAAGALAGALADHLGALELARGREQVPLETRVRPATVLGGVLLVLVATVLALRAAGRRVASADVERLLRRLPPGPPQVPPPGRRPVVAWSLGLLVLGGGLTAGAGGDLLRFTGLTLLLLAGWLHLRRSRADRERVDARAAAGGLAWFVVAPALLGDFARGDGGVESAFGLLVLAGAGAVVCATVLVSGRLRAATRLLRGYLPRRVQAPLVVAGAYAEEQRARGAVVTAVVGVTLFMVAALSVLGGATDLGLERQRGGFDVLGRSVAPLEPAELRALPAVGGLVAVAGEVLPETAFSVEDDDGARGTVPYPVTVLRADSVLAQAQSFGLADAVPGLDDSAAVLRELVGRSDAAVLTRYTRPDRARAGDTVVLDDGRGPREYELLGVLDTYALDGVLLGPAGYDAAFARGGPTRLLATAADGVPPAELADALADAGADRGLVVRTVSEAAEDVVRANRRFTDLFAALLVLALGVGLVAVVALLSRAAAERAAPLAVLRATGLRRGSVVTALVAEPLLLLVAGIGAGVATGLVVLRLLFATGLSDLTFSVAWQQLATASALAVVLLLVLGLPVAWRIAARPVDEGLRDLG